MPNTPHGSKRREAPASGGGAGLTILGVLLSIPVLVGTIAIIRRPAMSPEVVAQTTAAAIENRAKAAAARAHKPELPAEPAPADAGH